MTKWVILREIQAAYFPRSLWEIYRNRVVYVKVKNQVNREELAKENKGSQHLYQWSNFRNSLKSIRRRNLTSLRTLWQKRTRWLVISTKHFMRSRVINVMSRLDWTLLISRRNLSRERDMLLWVGSRLSAKMITCMRHLKSAWRL